MTAKVIPFARPANPPVRAADRESRRVFETPMEARLSLSRDKLGTVRRAADRVFVTTVDGAGAFSVADWDRVSEGAPRPHPCPHCRCGR